jgi:hypothetical protein
VFPIDDLPVGLGAPSYRPSALSVDVAQAPSV